MCHTLRYRLTIQAESEPTCSTVAAPPPPLQPPVPHSRPPSLPVSPPAAWGVIQWVATPSFSLPAHGIKNSCALVPPAPRPPPTCSIRLTTFQSGTSLGRSRPVLGSKTGRRWRGQGTILSSCGGEGMASVGIKDGQAVARARHALQQLCVCVWVWVGGGGRREAEGSGNDLDGRRIGGRAGWEQGDDIEQAGGGETIWRGS